MPKEHEVDESVHEVSQTMNYDLEFGIDYEQQRLDSVATTPV